MITIICKNNNQTIRVEAGTNLLEIREMFFREEGRIYIGALVNNMIEELSYKVYGPKTIQFLSIESPLGFKMYINSLYFLLYKAVNDIYPKSTLFVEHSTTNGFYCEIENLPVEKSQACTALKARMKELIEQDIPLKSKILPTEEVVSLLDERKGKDAIALVKSRNYLYTTVKFFENIPGIIYSRLVPSTAYLKDFDLKSYEEKDGFLLRFEHKNGDKTPKQEEKTKLFKVYREHKKWLKILEMPYINNLNEMVRSGKSRQIIQVSEALHEKNIIKIVDKISTDKQIKMVMIAGPSSSGKTTTCRRLAVQLSVLGYTPQEISLDNYFVDREHTPRDEKGDYDFERLEAVDVEFFNSNLLDLFAGKTIEIPKFDFITGKRYFDGEYLKLKENGILIVEGIHALNPNLTHKIDETLKYKIFVSPITQLSIDENNTIHSTDSRLVRRIVRDFNFRGYSAYDTLKRWESVTSGERKHIFPYQENCDMMLNTSLMYELAVLKKYAEPLLRTVPPNQSEYATAMALLSFLSLFESVSEEFIPPTSIMREFLGNSSFLY